MQICQLLEKAAYLSEGEPSAGGIVEQPDGLKITLDISDNELMRRIRQLIPSGTIELDVDLERALCKASSTLYEGVGVKNRKKAEREREKERSETRKGFGRGRIIDEIGGDVGNCDSKEIKKILRWSREMLREVAEDLDLVRPRDLSSDQNGPD
ncbi:hypothetical protein G5I_02852 [Acromyrmex echinatior]|uniref:Uncharacterized protein n=1 Tax=Acromyrmex echinatior TaxID=103372 RepID=F4WBE2_ACREC|nr:hypothetical protein G5I_02852 [Acromyrmex echinatior]